jgi:hypothetical protein
MVIHFYLIYKQGSLIETTHSNQLLIALEPEAASLYCKQLPAETFLGNAEEQMAKPNFEPGTKYLIVDAGGKNFVVILNML